VAVRGGRGVFSQSLCMVFSSFLNPSDHVNPHCLLCIYIQPILTFAFSNHNRM